MAYLCGIILMTRSWPIDRSPRGPHQPYHYVIMGPRLDSPLACPPQQATRLPTHQNVVMVQATDQGGQRQLRESFVADENRCEYLDPSSDGAWLHDVNPFLVPLKCHQLSQIETVYERTDVPARRTFVSNKQHAKVSAELVAERFGICPLCAQQTVRVTTQRGVRSATLPLSRRYRADRLFGIKWLNGKLATDTACEKMRSLRNKCRFTIILP